MNGHLFEKHNHGDQRTVAKKFHKGKELHFDGSTVILKTNVAMKVTEQYNSVTRTWQEIKYDLVTAVEITDQDLYERPPPTAMPGRLDPESCDHIAAIATNGPCPICFPRATAKNQKPWWRFW